MAYSGGRLAHPRASSLSTSPPSCCAPEEPEPAAGGPSVGPYPSPGRSAPFKPVLGTINRLPLSVTSLLVSGNDCGFDLAAARHHLPQHRLQLRQGRFPGDRLCGFDLALGNQRKGAA